ncbi:hypothetical protein K7G91_000886 [Pasteurella canis]|uniref:hypothetical protein n=1 Tax=Pasteurella canis TaxID=753 RepID=UPI001D1270E8|nr:hypothetical protein [Pasteurella canis]UDW84600.1 hypothetical protein K7G91_000886 [Pasteurella canis]
MTDQNRQQPVMLTDADGIDCYLNMRSVTAILELTKVKAVLLVFGDSSSINIPTTLDNLIETYNLNETTGFVTFTDPDSGDRILLNTHKKPVLAARKYDGRTNIIYDNNNQFVVKGTLSEVLEKLGVE